MSESTREEKDKGGKWLIEHHGDAILRMGGVTDLVRWQAGPAELVLPAKLPDGFLLAWRTGAIDPSPGSSRSRPIPSAAPANRRSTTCSWST